MQESLLLCSSLFDNIKQISDHGSKRQVMGIFSVMRSSSRLGAPLFLFPISHSNRDLHVHVRMPAHTPTHALKDTFSHTQRNKIMIPTEIHLFTVIHVLSHFLHAHNLRPLPPQHTHQPSSSNHFKRYMYSQRFLRKPIQDKFTYLDNPSDRNLVLLCITAEIMADPFLEPFVSFLRW